MVDEELFLELEGLYFKVFREVILDFFNKFIKIILEIMDEINVDMDMESEGIFIIMGIIGKYSGRLIFDMLFEVVNKFLIVLLWREFKNNEELFNVIFEIVNMFVGNVCFMINKKNKIFGLRVVLLIMFYGELISILKVELDNNYFVNVKIKFGDLLINIGFKRGEGEWLLII